MTAAGARAPRSRTAQDHASQGSGAEPAWVHPPQRQHAIDRVTRAFTDAFGAIPAGVWSAPGRVNLIGEHVDYNGGLCLPLALPHRTYVAAGGTGGHLLRLRSAQQADGWDGGLDDVGPGHPAGWVAYAAGVAWALREAGTAVPGLDICVDGHVPLGSGLSSSAALECAVAVAVRDLAGSPVGADEVDRSRLAAACVTAENVVAQAPTGGMDQSVSLLARPGSALLLDTGTGRFSHVPLDLAAQGLALLVMDTRAPHRLVDGQYAQRRSTCEQAARALGVRTLGEIAPAGLEGVLSRLADPVARRRVRHVVTEIERVRQVVALLEAGQVRRCGPLLDDSHASLRDDYEVSCPELDAAVETSRAAGALGSRMTGGGFGGSAVALVEADAADAVAAAVADVFARRGFRPPSFLPATPGGFAQRES